MSTFREWVNYTESEEYLEEEAVSMLIYLRTLQKISNHIHLSSKVFKDQEGYDDKQWVARFFDAGCQLMFKKKAYQNWALLKLAKFSALRSQNIVGKLCLVDDILYVFSEEASYMEDLQLIRNLLDEEAGLLDKSYQSKAKAKARAPQYTVEVCDLIEQIKSVIKQNEGRASICERALQNIRNLKKELLAMIYQDVSDEALSEQFTRLVKDATGSDLAEVNAIREECASYRFYERSDTADHERVVNICIAGRKEIMMSVFGSAEGVFGAFASLVKENCAV